MPETTDPTIQDQEDKVTAYVQERFAGDTYEWYDDPGTGYRVWEFDSAQNERWIDTDKDGQWDYGRRDEGYGVWSTFDGDFWRDSSGNIVGSGSALYENSDGPFGAEVAAMDIGPANDGWFL
jgi:hypothetical protein